MKRLLGIALGAALLFPVVFTKETALSAKAEDGFSPSYTVETLEETQAFPNLEIKAKSAYVMDVSGENVVYAKDETTRLPIASMCKIMTLVLCFDEIEKGNLSLDDTVQVSERASSMGGSQVFLEAGGEYTVGELIKSIVVCSANDSCVAMAEKIAGSESLFTERMNARAKELGGENTLFANCTGLPKEPQYSCAKDVALFLKELIRHDEYFLFSKIWTDRFTHPKGRYTDISNTNRLVRFYDGCDGGKTGFTNQAGFCLAATAKRGGLRMISVVIGEKTSDERFRDIRTTFDYAFANYTVKTVVDCNNPLPQKATVSGGKCRYVAVKPERDSSIVSKKGTQESVTLDVRLSKGVKAPVKVGDKVGEIVVYRDGIEIDRVKLVACESAKKADLMDRMKEIAENWNE